MVKLTNILFYSNHRYPKFVYIKKSAFMNYPHKGYPKGNQNKIVIKKETVKIKPVHAKKRKYDYQTSQPLGNPSLF